jgi:TonB family protein
MAGPARRGGLRRQRALNAEVSTRLLLRSFAIATFSLCFAVPAAWAETARHVQDGATSTDPRNDDPDFQPPVLLENPIAIQQSEPEYDTPPDLIAGKPIQYPHVLQQYGNIGKALVKLRILRDGTCTNIRFLESPHPAFEAAIVDNLLECRFKPALKNGAPVDADGILPIQFLINDFGPDRSVFPYSIAAQASATLPEALRYDTAPRLRIATGAVYPFDLARAGTTGSAKIAFSISASGKVAGTHVLKATHSEFGLAAAAMLESWAFEPALKNGKPIATQLSKTVSFRSDVRDAALPAASRDLLRQLRKDESRFHRLDQLDRAPATRYTVAPVYPRNLLRQNLRETAMIEFILDQEGRVHLPRIVDAAHPEFGWSAATALARWRFEPPLHQGKPVAARLQIPFEFSPPKNTQPETAP